jgi:hypothetical protein
MLIEGSRHDADGALREGLTRHEYLNVIVIFES